MELAMYYDSNTLENYIGIIEEGNYNFGKARRCTNNELVRIINFVNAGIKLKFIFDN